MDPSKFGMKTTTKEEEEEHNLYRHLVLKDGLNAEEE